MALNHLHVPHLQAMLLFYTQTACGYPLEMFVGIPPEGLLCFLCWRPAREATQHSTEKCGKVFCSACLEKRCKPLHPCPSCKQLFGSNCVRDYRTDNEVKKLKAKCINKGCPWKGVVRDADSHLKSCDYRTVSCDYGCDQVIQKRQLETHLKRCPRRTYQCSHCKEEGEHHHMTGPGHLNICPDVKITCRFCNNKVKRLTIEYHERECQEEEVACQYLSVGCKTRPKRKDITEHNIDAVANHLELAVGAIKQLRQDMTRIVYSTGALTSTIVKMENISKFLKAKTSRGKTWHSNTFHTNATMGYTARLRVAVGTEDIKFVSCYICLVKGEYDTHLWWPFKGTFTITLLNHTVTGEHYSKQVVIDNGRQPTEAMETIIICQEFIPIEDLTFTQDHQYIKGNSLYFKVTVDNIRTTIDPELFRIA